MTQCQDTPTVLRTRIYRAKCTPPLNLALARCRYDQRVIYNKTISDVPAHRGVVLAKQKSPAYPAGLSGRLTRWRTETPWVAEVPIVIARTAP